jgi:hypothetical protein
MIFQTLSDALQDKESTRDYIEIMVKVPRNVLEKAIQDALEKS